MKIILIVIANILFFCDVLSAQALLIAEGSSPNLYLTHKVAAKENFYSIGRLYNVSPKELAPYNNLSLQNGLSLGQTIKIPLKQNNFLQNDVADANSMTPVYHIVEPKEGLYHLSTTYNKVSGELLKKWNNLQTDEVNSGAKLIIGYLNVQKGQSTAVQKIESNSPATISKAPDEVKEPATNTDLPKKEEIKSPAPDTKNDAAVKNDVPVKEEVKQKAEEAKQQPEVQQKRGEVVFNKSSIDFKGGMFKNMYDDQIRKKTETTESGSSGVFKSTSGWQDGKYYCFHNSAAPGTIMKITNTSTGKSVYAKVLDLIPDIKQNQGLILHISNAAAEELGVGENKFDCSLSYAK